MKRERFHYPYRVAIAYSDFYDKFAPAITLEEKQEIGRAAKFVLERIQELPKYTQEQRYVQECQRAMEYVMEKAFATA